MPVLLPSPPECAAATGQRDGGARLVSDAQRGLQGRIAAAHDQDVLALVLLRVDESIDHLRQVLAGYAELARRAAQPQRLGR